MSMGTLGFYNFIQASGDIIYKCSAIVRPPTELLPNMFGVRKKCHWGSPFLWLPRQSHVAPDIFYNIYVWTLGWPVDQDYIL